eukprot:7200647-Alexandrium_andersonii.AAC.1
MADALAELTAGYKDVLATIDCGISIAKLLQSPGTDPSSLLKAVQADDTWSFSPALGVSIAGPRQRCAANAVNAADSESVASA